jgi:putative tryptophan/tyrosine transport system substrate-binding protein
VKFRPKNATRFCVGGIRAVAWPLVARAQQQTKPVIGVLDSQVGGPPREWAEGFRRGLAEVGFSVGRDVTVEYYLADGHPEQLSALAADLVRRRPAAIVARAGLLDAKAATRDIPIIFGTGGDPVELGLVASLNRPGGNLTGITTLSDGVAAKRLSWASKSLLSSPSNLRCQCERGIRTVINMPNRGRIRLASVCLGAFP